jgi:hypothetical protein
MRKTAVWVLLTGAAALTACQEPVSTDPGSLPRHPAFTRVIQESPSGDPRVLAMMRQANKRLRDRGLHLAIESIEYFTIGKGRPADRLHQFDSRWVPDDPNRLALSTSLRFLIATNRGATSSGLTATQTAGAIRAAVATWGATRQLRHLPLVERPYVAGHDFTLFDDLFFNGKFDDFPNEPANIFVADIVEAGFLPRAFFDSLAGGPAGGANIIGFTPSFVFTDDQGNPVDLNGDNYIDVALSEMYLNDTFGDPNAPDNRKNFPWGINVDLPGIDVQSIALHENGHAFQIGHFGPPPRAVMNPVYGGLLQQPLPTDLASLSTLWSSWPHR